MAHEATQAREKKRKSKRLNKFGGARGASDKMANRRDTEKERREGE